MHSFEASHAWQRILGRTQSCKQCLGQRKSRTELTASEIIHFTISYLRSTRRPLVLRDSLKPKIQIGHLSSDGAKRTKQTWAMRSAFKLSECKSTSETANCRLGFGAAHCCELLEESSLCKRLIIRWRLHVEMPLEARYHPTSNLTISLATFYPKIKGCTREGGFSRSNI